MNSAFKRILIANRGEIAIRIIYACKELGIETVAIYSEADKDSLHTYLADQAVCIGPAHSSESYLNIPRIISTAEITGCDAIHPGYGFLAENAEFAEMVESSNFVFIGPSPDAISKMGDKSLARKLMKSAGVEVVPGSEDNVSTLEQGFEIAETLGFPVLLKASAGGGGRGMRVSWNKKDFETNFRTAQAEALAAFKDGRLYIEKYIENPRHIEVQIAGDKYGNCIHFFERECSIQRRHQKLLEEAPSPALDEKSRKKLTEMAVIGAKSIQYNNVGTMEFIMGPDKKFYFIEMNTRIQVEHPVTEFITGIDLIKLQIKIAEGKPIPFEQKDVKIFGHSIEARINAEDPERGFSPCPGEIKRLHFPYGPGIRIDSFIYQNYKIPQFYDSLISKIIVFGQTREEAINRLRRALQECIIDGVKNTIPLFLKILDNEDFLKGNISTNFVENILNK